MNTIYRARAARHEERGQTMTEYVIVLGIISLGILIALGALSTGISVAINGAVSLIP